MKEKILFLLLNVLLISSLAFSQKQNNQWRYGTGAGINFNATPAVAVTGSAMVTPEGSASVADKNTGALLFYTDGVTVWNAQNQIMPNGTGLFGGQATLLSSTTAAVIIPKPGSNSQYYIVTIDEQASNNGICYSIVDMSLLGGLGDVVANQKNIPLFQTNSEKIEVVPAANRQDYWIVTHDNPGNTFYSFLLTGSGFQTTPVVSTTGATHGNGSGHIKINRQFDKLACGGQFNRTMELFDFNNSTGEVSNPIAWNLTATMQNFSPLIYGVEFSPDGRVLYINNLNIIVQYDISQTSPLAIQNSAYQLAPAGFVQPASMQLAPDGKIYCNSGSIYTVNCPNKLGSSCGYQLTNLPGGGYGLPKWVYYPNELPQADTNYIKFSDSCFGNTTHFMVLDTTGVTGITWSFGDPTSGVGNTASGNNVSHAFSQPAIYNIKAILSKPCGNDTLLLNGLQITNCGSYFDGEIIYSPDSCIQNTIAFSLTDIQNVTNFLWNFDDPNSGINNTSNSGTANHIFSNTGSYEVTCIITVNCGSAMSPCFYADTVIKTIQIFDCNISCIGNINTTGDLCAQNNVSFSINSNQSIIRANWNFDDLASGIANASTSLTPTHLFADTGTYTINCIVELSCGIDTIVKTVRIVNCDTIPSECQLFIPSAFSPNADNVNEVFGALTRCSTNFYELLIYNRWGQLIFKTSDISEKWDGKYKKSNCPSDNYIYLIRYQFPGQERKLVKGSIMLFR